MSNNLAVVNQTVVPSFTPDQIFDVRVTVKDNVITVDQPYIKVDETALAQITWTLDVANSDEGVQFDRPAITFFGEMANVMWLEPRPNIRAALWLNDHPHRSYSYRIHILRKTVENGVTTYSPITEDPIIHNEPPPAP